MNQENGVSIKLLGLPPMMTLEINVDGVSTFVVQIESMEALHELRTEIDDAINDYDNQEPFDIDDIPF